MDYIVAGAYSSDFTLIQDVLQKVNDGFYGDHIGITYASGIDGYMDHTIFISTKIEYIADSLEGPNVAASCIYRSGFMFLNKEILTKGVNDLALETLRDCLDLAQSHAYSLFCYHSKMNGVPLSEFQLQPFEHFERAFVAFLEHNRS